MQILVNVVTWNDLSTLPGFFESLALQSTAPATIRILDNGSSDGSLNYIHSQHSAWLVARHMKNQGFAAGHNQLIKFALERWGDDLNDKAILMTGGHVQLDPEVLTELARVLESDPSLGAVQPKIMCAFNNLSPDEVADPTVSSDVLDSTGLRLTKSWRLVDRGSGELDRGQYDEQREILGPSGTCALWRASALKALTYNGEVLDNDFFSYLEDADLAIRARRAGFKTAFVPSAKVQHRRNTPLLPNSWWGRVYIRRQDRSVITAFRARNQVLLWIKNLTMGDWLRAWPFILAESFLLLIATLVDKSTRALMFKSFGLMIKMLRKRTRVLASVQDSAKLLREYVKA